MEKGTAMPVLELNDKELIVRMNLWETIAAFQRDIRIPLHRGSRGNGRQQLQRFPLRPAPARHRNSGPDSPPARISARASDSSFL